MPVHKMKVTGKFTNHLNDPKDRRLGVVFDSEDQLVEVFFDNSKQLIQAQIYMQEIINEIAAQQKEWEEQLRAEELVEAL